MDLSFRIVVFTICLQFVCCSVQTYKAAYVKDVKMENFARLIPEASKMNADILVLPSPERSSSESMDTCSMDNEEIIKSISDASRKGKLYVVAHLLEKIRCQGQPEIIRNNFVFDRDGAIIAMYRKPLQESANCNITNDIATTFTTDFGVTFGLLMEEDLVLKNAEDMNVKNFILAGKSSTSIPFLSANEFSSSWSYATNANLVSNEGVFAGRSGLKTGSGGIVVAELAKDGGEDEEPITFNGPKKLKNFPGEDLSQYTIRPLDVEASAHGYHEVVCHDTFCCEFNLKTSIFGNPKEVNYGLMAFSGTQHYGHTHSIGSQSCSVLACAGLYKRSCFLSSDNTTNIIFNKLSISGNFTKNSVQFPIVQTTVDTTVTGNDFYMNAKSDGNQEYVRVELYNMKDVLRFGIFARDYSRDVESVNQNKSVFAEHTDYISRENVEEFFDYLWIRLRVVIFVVSIYILEMM